MNTMLKHTLLAGAVAVLCLSASQLAAQNQPPPQQRQGGGGPGGGRGNFDPAQMQQRMMDRYKEVLEFTSDDEWNAVKPLVQKVMDARRDVGFGGMGRGMFGMGRRGGDNAPQGDQAQAGARRGFGEPSQAQQDLQKALDAKASADEIKGKLAKVRDDRKAKEAALTKAQDDLKKVLNARREAQAVLAGLLN
jgi:hypothetical protein